MQHRLLADDDLPDGAAIASAMSLRPNPGVFDEWRAVPGDAVTGAGQPVSARWQQFFGLLGRTGWSELADRLARVRHHVQEDGASYNVHADGADTVRPWPLEVLPFIVDADDWALIEDGVLQRARLLEATLADIYGDQRLLRDAMLPASLIYAHPQYLRAAHRLLVPGRPHLHLVAFDLARRPDGRFQVLAQRVGAPSGLGYLLENRLVISQQFPNTFAEMHVQRLAASFRALLEGLMAASPAGARSRMVLLTPGRYSETYFEQVFLARYLGLTLVEGSDLTVRGQRLYLKTLRGLEQVHVVLRRVDDEFLDPLELRADSALGVPGLLQAVRAGEVVLANAPGAGVLETPGLAAFWPAISRHLLQEELKMPAATSWWCGESVVWRAQRDRLAEFVVAPTFQTAGVSPRVAAALSPAALRQLRARIDADPAAYALQARVWPSETPVWVGGRLQPRAAVLRVFTIADGRGGWSVLPGAFTRVAGTAGGSAGQWHAAERRSVQRQEAAQSDPWLSMQHGASSVDTWVLTRDRIDQSTLLPPPLSVEDVVKGRRVVTSRAAENLFWLGRYIERAENSTRLARLTLEMLPEGSSAALQLLGSLCQFQGLVAMEVPSPGQSPRVFTRALIEGLRADSGCTSVGAALRSLQAGASALRERLSVEHWRLVHDLVQHFEAHLGDALSDPAQPAPTGDVLGVLARAATHLAAVTGGQTDRMTRDDGWRLMSVGRQIERVSMLASSLAMAFEQQVLQAEDGFALVLGLFDSVITYRAQYQGRREVLPLLQVTVFDTDNPRSLAWVARTMRDRLRKLAPSDATWVDQALAEMPLPDLWDLAQLGQVDEHGQHATLIAALWALSDSARQLSDLIGRHLFAHVASVERRVWQ